MSNDTGNDCDFGGPIHPFSGAKYAKFEAGKPVTFALVERKSMSTTWRAEGTGDKVPWTKSKEEGERNGWAQHDSFAAVIAEPDGTFTRCRIDVKSRLRYAFRAMPVKRGTWYTMTRSGAGKQTEYAIVVAAKTTKAMAECLEDCVKACAGV